MLDGRGEVVATNDAWRLFAFLHGGPAPGASVNYLDVCDRSARRGDAVAASVADGLREVIAGDRHHLALEYSCETPTEDRWFFLRAGSVPVGDGEGVLVTHEDISAHRLRDLAVADPDRDGLTGLANRRAGIHQLDKVLRGAPPGDAEVRVLVASVDDFDAVNRRHGRRVGDEALVRVAARILRVVRSGDLLYRSGGREFVLVCPNLAAADADSLASRLRDVVAEPIEVGAAEVSVSVSIGIADNGASTSSEDLLASAGAGMLADREERQWKRAAVRPFGSPPSADGLGSPVDPGLVGVDPKERAPHPYRAVIDAMGEGLIVQDPTGYVQYANSEARRLLGLERISSTAMPHGGIIVDADGNPMAAEQMPGRSALRNRAPVRDRIIGVRSSDGETRWLEITSQPVTADGASEPHAVASTLRDVSDRRAATDQLRMQARLLDSVGQAVVAWDPAGAITYVNRAATELYGWPASGMEGANVLDATSPVMNPSQLRAAVEAMIGGWSWEGEFTVGRLDGSRRPVWAINTPVFDGDKIVGAIGISADISERKAAEAVLAHQASHDLLTGLLDRRALVELIDGDGSAGVAAAPDRALVLVSVGTLETVNDAFGHELGDQVITRCAHVLRQATHPGDVTARFSDHTFAVWCPHAGSDAAAFALAERLRSLLDRPLEVEGIDVRLRASAAVARRTGDDVDAAEILRRAATALATARGDRPTRVYDSSMRADLLRQVEVQGLVDQALASGTVGLAYQPIMRLDDEQTVGAEALLRMVGPAGEPISPVEVIEAAERNGRIEELGDLILRTACADAVRWGQGAPERTIPVSVNLSARELDDPKLPSLVAAALAETGLDPSALCLEVTESAIMSDPVRSAGILTELKAQGIRLSADDFGTGYSSLAYLKAFPLDELKIDQSFVAGLPDKAEDVAIVEAILAMAGALGLSVVCEGIETAAHLVGVRSLGAACGQGYLWSRAIPSSKFEAWLAAEADRRAASSPSGRADPLAVDVEAVKPAGAASEERIDSVLDVLAHELRSPLAVVSGYASLLGQDTTVSTTHIRDSIERAVIQMDQMLGSMVEVADIDDTAALEGLVATDAGSFVESVVGDLSAARPGRTLTVIPPADPLWILADVTQLGQAIGNLVRNADRHGPVGTPIEIEIAAAENGVELTVSDHGPGVSPEHLALVFRKYGRVGAGAGTGLGLFVARRIARSHGGDVLYRRREDGPGACFCLRIPRCDPWRSPERTAD